MTNEPKVRMNPWIPMRNPVDVATIGNLQEELGELQAILARCLIQGIHEKEPRTGKVNKDQLQEEIGDVLAGLTVCVDRFKLDHQFTNERAVVKGAQLREWHGLIEEKAAPVKPPEPEPEELPQPWGQRWRALLGL